MGNNGILVEVGICMNTNLGFQTWTYDKKLSENTLNNHFCDTF